MLFQGNTWPGFNLLHGQTSQTGLTNPTDSPSFQYSDQWRPSDWHTSTKRGKRDLSKPAGRPRPCLPQNLLRGIPRIPFVHCVTAEIINPQFFLTNWNWNCTPNVLWQVQSFGLHTQHAELGFKSDVNLNVSTHLT